MSFLPVSSLRNVPSPLPRQPRNALGYVCNLYLPFEGRENPLDTGDTGPICVDNIKGGLCPVEEIDVSRHCVYWLK